MKASKVLKAYYAGQAAAMANKPSNMPKGLTKDQQKAWRNGYNDSWLYSKGRRKK